MAARTPRRRPQQEPAVADLVRQLGALLRELDLAEIEASVGTVRVRLQRQAAAPAPPLPAAVPAPPPMPVPAPASVSETVPPTMITIEAPMVGTFYRASSPGADPYVREGDVVKEGQILCIIEAMKLMNEIESRAAGRIAKILVENGQPVEYGQPLFLIEPAR